MRNVQEPMKGSRIGAVPPANRQRRPGRVCAQPGCGTVLSVYNLTQRCWEHQPRVIYINRGERRRKKPA